MNTSYLKIFVDWRERYQKLSDAEFGRLIRAAIAYKADGAEVELTGRESLVWDGIKLDIDRDNERFEHTKQARSEAGKKGADRRWMANANSDMAKMANANFAIKQNGKNGQEKEKEEDKEKDKRISPLNPPTGEWESMCDPDLIGTVKDFIRHRKAIKKPISDHAIVLMLKKLGGMAKTTQEKREILENSIMNGWQGIFPLDKKKGQRSEYIQRSYSDDELLGMAVDLDG